MYANIATAKDRLTAFYFNFLVFAALVFLLSQGLLKLGQQLFGRVAFIDCILSAIILILLVNLFISLNTKGDLGKWIMGLEIQDLHGDLSLTKYQILLRTFLSYISFLIFGLGSIAMIFNAERLTLHDLCANTLVVENPNYNRKMFLVKAFHFLSLLTGSLVSLAIFTISICAPVPLLSNYLYETNITGYDSAAFYSPAIEDKPELIKEEFNIPLSNNQVYALVHLKDSAEYMDFTLDPQSEKNYINQQTLEKLGIAQTKISRYFQQGEQPWVLTVLPYINLHALTFKDINSQEINIKNQIFHIHSGENKLGREFLDLFNYSIDTENSQLILKAHAFDSSLFPEKLKPKSKIILSQIYRKINKDWSKQIKLLNQQNPSEQKLIYDIIFDSVTGQIIEITLLERPVDQALTSYAEKFLKNYVISTKLNKELKRINKIKLKLELPVN